MKSKEIFKIIELELFKQYKNKIKFIEETGRSQQGFYVLMSRVLEQGKDTTINSTEAILNDLGYELCVRPLEREEDIKGE